MADKVKWLARFEDFKSKFNADGWTVTIMVGRVGISVYVDYVDEDGKKIWTDYTICDYFGEELSEIGWEEYLEEIEERTGFKYNQ